MTNLGCFTCLNCGRINPIKGHSYTNKYCNNSCQQQHRSRQLTAKKVDDWKENSKLMVWKEVPDYIKNYLISTRGHQCEMCSGTTHNGKEIPLVADYIDGDIYNNSETNLHIICPNCKELK